MGSRAASLSDAPADFLAEPDGSLLAIFLRFRIPTDLASHGNKLPNAERKSDTEYKDQLDKPGHYILAPGSLNHPGAMRRSYAAIA